ncbi:hypothetical protein WDU94_003159, partial [Cyamophila willieti]
LLILVNCQFLQTVGQIIHFFLLPHLITIVIFFLYFLGIITSFLVLLETEQYV